MWDLYDFISSYSIPLSSATCKTFCKFDRFPLEYRYFWG
ncbi:hypothetical protein MHA_2651 [Mannheimia haemolytica PHL213]|nr:hypothetical protein MHA_2651 [Mannheimia haemolytica PHL213]